MAGKNKKQISGLDINLQTVPVTNSGALYQVVEGDPSNADYMERMEASRKAVKEMED
jgi:hypothetical protein